MAGLELKNICKSFGRTEVLKDLSLNVVDGEFLSLVGESGCGKSTLLRIISGLETPDSGEVLIGGKGATGLSPKQRNIAMVFQDYALYPHMSVGQNIAMPLIMAQLPLLARLPLLNKFSPQARALRPAIAQDVETVARQLRIDHLLERRPAELSGGQRQRVALGRALVRNPGLFLMDEPLSNLDAKLRVEVRREITELHDSSGLTFVYVTHDQTEAMTMSDRVAFLQKGQLLQLDKPSDLYTNPQSIDVARFIGSPEINILPVDIQGGRLHLGGTPLPVRVTGAGACAFVGLRPEALFVSAGAAQSAIRLSFTCQHAEDLGHEVLLHGILPSLPDVDLRLRHPKTTPHTQATRLQGPFSISFDCSNLLFFGENGQRLNGAQALPLDQGIVA